MKTVVIYKWARDVQNAAVRADGSIDWRSEKMVPGEDDSAALTTALALTGDNDELVGLTIGAGDASWALARGVLQAVSVEDAPFTFDNAVTAEILAAAVKHIGDVDTVVIGDANEFSAVAPLLAGKLNALCVAQVHSAAPGSDGGVDIKRQNNDAVETLHTDGPVVLAVSAVGADTKKPGMKEQLAARKRPISKITLADLGIDVTETVSELSTRLPETNQARIFDGDNAATDLIATLRSEGVLS